MATKKKPRRVCPATGNLCTRSRMGCAEDEVPVVKLTVFGRGPTPEEEASFDTAWRLGGTPVLRVILDQSGLGWESARVVTHCVQQGMVWVFPAETNTEKRMETARGIFEKLQKDIEADIWSDYEAEEIGDG